MICFCRNRLRSRYTINYWMIVIFSTISVLVQVAPVDHVPVEGDRLEYFLT